MIEERSWAGILIGAAVWFVVMALIARRAVRIEAAERAEEERSEAM